ncbi:MAG: hypothetical protein ACTSU5_06765 [Promethearchaeota archaeon]
MENESMAGNVRGFYSKVVAWGKKILVENVNLIIIAGFAIRVAFLLFFAYRGSTLSGVEADEFWSDIHINLAEGKDAAGRLARGEDPYPRANFPLLGLLLLAGLSSLFTSELAFGVFSGLLEILVSLMVYPALKAWGVKNAKFLWSLFLFNPFWMVKEFVGVSGCGYHITDLIYMLFVLAAMWTYPMEIRGSRENGKRVAYIFIGLSVGAKMFTLPVLAYVFIKDFVVPYTWKAPPPDYRTRDAPPLAIQEPIEPDLRKRLVNFAFLLVPTLLSFFSAFLIFPGFLESLIFRSADTQNSVPFSLPLVVRLIPGLLIFGVTLTRIRSLSFPKMVIGATCVSVSILFWNNLYLRYLATLVPFALLLDRNHLLNWLSVLGVGVTSYLLILDII